MFDKKQDKKKVKVKKHKRKKPKSPKAYADFMKGSGKHVWL